MAHIQKYGVQLDMFAYLYKPSETFVDADMIVDSFYILVTLDGVKYRLLYTLIDSLDKKNDLEIVIVCKTHDIWRARFDTSSESFNAYMKILTLIKSQDQMIQYAYMLRMNLGETYPVEDDIDYKIHEQAARMEVDEKLWRVSTVNQDNALSSSLPEYIIVPKNIEDSSLKSLSKFRMDRMLPYVCFHHPLTGNVLTRSSQPLMGPTCKRSVEDEQYVHQLLLKQESSSFPCIIDVRSKKNVSIDRISGGGTESDGNYPSIRMYFTNVLAADEIFESYQRMINAVRNVECSASNYLLEVSPWTKQIQACLKPSIFISKAISVDSVSCLVHCQDGIHASSAVVSLSKLLMDPFYRTIKGFQILIEEDWIHVGFNFSRKNFSNKEKVDSSSPNFSVPRSSVETLSSESSASLEERLTLTTDQVVSVFCLFLDCVHQCWHNFPREFEFNLDYLSFIYEHCISCNFGNFMRSGFAKNETYSIWSFVNQESTSRFFKNVFFSPIFKNLSTEKNHHVPPLPMTSDSRQIRFWSGFYDAFEKKKSDETWGKVKWRCDFIGCLDKAPSWDINLIKRNMYDEIAMKFMDSIEAKREKALRLKKNLEKKRNYLRGLSTLTT